MQNHVLDPTFFYDCIDEFSFEYTIYTVNQTGVDEYGNTGLIYDRQKLFGSMQIQGRRENQSKDGNTDTVDYKLYCKSLYRIDIGDIVEYQNNYYRCIEVMPYNEYGVREASLTMIQLTAYRDFAKYLKYLEGEKIV